MSAEKSTPGPWTQCDRIVIVCPPSHEYLTLIADVSVGGQSKVEILANARLIAAAPDLMAALQSCLDYGSMTGDSWVIDKAEAAISKATGAAA